MRQWIVPLSLLLLLSACSSTSQDKDAVVAAAATNPPASESVVKDNSAQNKDNIAIFVKNNADNFANYAMKFAKSDDFAKEVQKIIDESQAAQKAKKKKVKDSAVKLVQPDGLKSLYESHQYAPIFVSGGSLPTALDPLLNELDHLEDHGLGKTIDLQPWRDAIAALGENKPDAANDKFTFTAEEQATITNLIVERNIDVRDQKAVSALIAELVKDDNLMPRLHQTVTERIQQQSQHAQQNALADVLTADVIMQFARAMKFNNLTHLTEEETAQIGKKPSDAKYKAITEARTNVWMHTLTSVLDSPAPGMKEEDSEAKAEKPADTAANAETQQDEFAAAVMDEAADAHKAEAEAAAAEAAKMEHASSVQELVDALYPAHPDYKKLMEARRHYAELPDWESISSMPLKKGKTFKNLPALRKRLAAEGYYHGDVSPEALSDKNATTYDDEIRAAVQLYHEAHQLDYDETEGMKKSFWESLNTPRQKRLDQIDANLRRWHNTQIIDSPYYIFVNVPEFYGEVWRDGKRVYRFPVVAGNAKRACDPQTKQWKFINATPLQHARMLYIEYNPYWNVPPRIEQEDYIEKINADPTWLTTHGYEYYTSGGHTILRQLPSEKNALGRVKFIFPNPHSTFLHDSPQKHFFKYPIRAFSHGCMRVWKPLDLAKLLLEYDGQWYPKLAKEIDEKNKDDRLETKRFVLKNRFDVFIDYFTVRTDDEGLVHFFADPYKYIRYELDPPKPSELRCKPKPKAWIARTSLQAGGDAGADAGGGADVGADDSSDVSPE